MSTNEPTEADNVSAEDQMLARCSIDVARGSPIWEICRLMFRRSFDQERTVFCDSMLQHHWAKMLRDSAVNRVMS